MEEEMVHGFCKHPCNNVEVPQYFLRKLWVEFVLGFHVNYFDITEFKESILAQPKIDLTPTKTHSKDLLHLGEIQTHFLNHLG